MIATRLLSLTAVRSLRSLASARAPDKPAARGRGLGLRPKKTKLHCHHASFPIWPLKKSGRREGRDHQSNFNLGGRSTQPDPLASGDGVLCGPPPPSGVCRPFGRSHIPCPGRAKDIRLPRLRAAGIRACRACRPVGRPQDRGTASTVGGHRRPPRHPVHDPGSRESDGVIMGEAQRVLRKIFRISFENNGLVEKGKKSIHGSKTPRWAALRPVKISVPTASPGLTRTSPLTTWSGSRPCR